MELGQSCCAQDPHDARSTPRVPDAVSNSLAENSSASTEDESGREGDFERRLQYAMEQSLLLQEKQLKDIEKLQEELAEDQQDNQPQNVARSKIVVERIRKPLKGILKKTNRYSTHVKTHSLFLPTDRL